MFGDMGFRSRIGTLLLLAATGLAAQTAVFDAFRYQPPPGYTGTAQKGSMIYARINQERKFYCQLAIYQAQRSLGSAEADFANEWKAVVLPSFKPTATVAPKAFQLPNAPESIFGMAESVDNNRNKAINTLFIARFGDRYVGILFNSPNEEAFRACNQDAYNVAASIELQTPAAPAVVSTNTPVGRWQRVIASQTAMRYNPFSKQWEYDPVQALNQFRNKYIFEFSANGTYAFTLDAENFNRNERSMVVEKGTWAATNGAIQFTPQSTAEGKGPRAQPPPLTAKATPAAHARRFFIGEHPQYKDSAGLQLQTNDGSWETYKPLL